MAAWRNHRPWVRQPTALPVVDRGAPLSRGLVSYYVAGESTAWRDIAGPYPGTPTGTLAPTASFIRGAPVNARNFDGASFVNLGSMPVVKGAGAGGITVALWVRPSSLVNAYTTLFGWFDGAFDSFHIQLKSNGKLSINISAAGAVGRSYDGTGVATLAVNEWRQIVVSWNPVSGVCGTYVDGVLDATIIADGTFSASTTNVFLGKDNITGGRILSGLMSDVGLFRCALSSVEVNSLYRAPWQLFAPLPRRIWAPAVGVRFDSVSNSGFMGASADYTFARTVAGTDRFLVVDVAVLSAGSNVVSVTDDSGGANAAMTLIASRATGTGSGLIESWGRIAPATGTKNIRVQLSTAVSTASSAANYTGVHQTAPTEAVSSNIGTNATPTDATVSITPVAAGTWIHAALATNDNSCSSADRRDSIADMVGGSLETMDTRGTVPAATAREMRVTGLGGTAVWTILGFAIRPNTAAGGGSSIITPAAGVSTTSALTGKSRAVAALTAAAGATAASTLTGKARAVATLTAAAGVSTTSTLAGKSRAVAALSAAAGLSATSILTGKARAVAAITGAAGLSTASTLAGKSRAVAAITPAAGLTTTTTLSGAAGGAVITPAAGVTTTSTLTGRSRAAATITTAAGVSTASTLAGKSRAVATLTPAAGVSVTSALAGRSAAAALVPAAGSTTTSALSGRARAVASIVLAAGRTSTGILVPAGFVPSPAPSLAGGGGASKRRLPSWAKQPGRHDEDPAQELMDRLRADDAAIVAMVQDLFDAGAFKRRTDTA